MNQVILDFNMCPGSLWQTSSLLPHQIVIQSKLLVLLVLLLRLNRVLSMADFCLLLVVLWITTSMVVHGVVVVWGKVGGGP